MKSRSDQSGFSVVELAIVVLFLGIIGFVGYAVYNRQHKTDVATNANSQTSAVNSAGGTVSTAPDINSTSDLNKALNTLNQNDPTAANSSDSAQFNAQTNSL